MALGGGAAAAIYYGVAAAAAVGGLAQGHESARAARSGRKRQAEAQDKAQATAASQQRENQIAQNRANRKKPDIGAILASAQGAGGGIGSTMLTGPGGVGGKTLLGG